MKKYNLTLIIVLFITYMNAQVETDAQSAIISFTKQIENSKTGNYKDIFNSFYQVALKSLTDNEKVLEFNTTLFSVYKNYNPQALQQVSRSELYFLRNLQANMKLELDDKYKFKGYAGGITYAIINKRDKEAVTYTGHILNAYTTFLASGAVGMGTAIAQIPGIAGMTPAQRTDLSKRMQVASRELLSNPTTQNTDALNIKAAIDADIAAKAAMGNVFLDDIGMPIANTDAFIAYLQSIRAKYLASVEAMPLWTISVDGSIGSNGKCSKASVGTIFLKGNSSNWNEIDLRAKFFYADTTTAPINKPRTAFNTKVGMNFKLLKDYSNKSYLELKTYGEYNLILKNSQPGEDKMTFLANTDIRLRLTDDLWIPFTIKYDTNAANFLGFLNITYNFGN